jgi:hypothetical protein
MVAGGPILEKMAGVMLDYEEFQHFIKQLAVADPIYHFTFLGELQSPFPPPVETAPQHHLLLVLHSLPGELQGKAVQASGPPAAGLLAPKSQFKIALIREHYPLSIFHPPVHMLRSKCQPLFPHPLFSWREEEGLQAAVLDLPDTQKG